MPESNTTQPRKIHYKETRNTLWLLQTLVDQQHVNLISMKLLLSESCWIIILSILSYTEHQDSIFMHCTYCSALQLCDWSGYDSFFSSCVERPLMTDMHQQHNNITNRLFQKKNHNGFQKILVIRNEMLELVEHKLPCYINLKGHCHDKAHVRSWLTPFFFKPIETVILSRAPRIRRGSA